jgi:hypothetical protein
MGPAARQMARWRQHAAAPRVADRTSLPAASGLRGVDLERIGGRHVPSGATSSAARSGSLSSASTLITLTTLPGGKLARTRCCGHPGCRRTAASAQAASTIRYGRIISKRRIASPDPDGRGRSALRCSAKRRAERESCHSRPVTAAKAAWHNPRRRPASTPGRMPAWTANRRLHGDLGAVEDRFFTIRDFRLTQWRDDAGGGDRLRDLWPARAGRPQRGAGHPRLYRQPSRRRPQPGERQPARLVGRPRSAPARRSTPTGSSSSPRTCSARRSARPTRRAATRRPASPTAPISRTSRSATSSPRKRRCSIRLGVKHLVAVAGPSYGGYQGFQWAVAYPDFMDGIVAVNTAPWASVNTDKQLAEVTARLAADPGWHGGRYYGNRRRQDGADRDPRSRR